MNVNPKSTTKPRGTFDFAATYFGAAIGREADAWVDGAVYWTFPVPEGVEYAINVSLKSTGDGGALATISSMIPDNLFYQLVGYCDFHEVESHITN